MAKKKFKLGFKINQDGRASCGFALLYIIFILIDFIKIFVLSEKFGEGYRENKIQEELNKINK